MAKKYMQGYVFNESIQILSSWLVNRNQKFREELKQEIKELFTVAAQNVVEASKEHDHAQHPQVAKARALLSGEHRQLMYAFNPDKKSSLSTEDIDDFLDKLVTRWTGAQAAGFPEFTAELTRSAQTSYEEMLRRAKRRYDEKSAILHNTESQPIIQAYLMSARFNLSLTPSPYVLSSIASVRKPDGGYSFDTEVQPPPENSSSIQPTPLNDYKEAACKALRYGTSIELFTDHLDLVDGPS